MAKLVLSLEEICQLLESQFPQNEKLKLIECKPQGKDILVSLKIKILPPISVKLIFNHYEDGWLFFRLESKKLINLFLEFIKTQPASWLKVKNMNLAVEVSQLFSKMIPELNIYNLFQDVEGNFIVEFKFDVIFT